MNWPALEPLTAKTDEQKSEGNLFIINIDKFDVLVPAHKAAIKGRATVVSLNVGNPRG